MKEEPISKVIDLLENGQIKDTDKAKIWMEVCKYFYKVPKDQLEITGGLEVQKVFISPELHEKTLEHIKQVINDQ